MKLPGKGMRSVLHTPLGILISAIRRLNHFGLLRTGVGMSMAQAVTVLAGIGIGVLLARGLGVADYGRYIFALALVQFFMVPLDFGLPTLVMRQVAIYRSQKEWSSLAGILRWSVGLVVLVLGTISLGMLAWLWFWPGAAALPGDTRALYLFAVALAGGWAFMRLASAILRGIERVFWGSIPNQVIRPLVFLGTLSVVPMFVSLTPALAMALHAGAAILGAGWALWMLWQRSEVIPSGVTPSPVFHTRVWIRSLLPMGMIVGAGAINSRLDVFMLGVLSTPAQVGIYGLALLLAGMVSMPQMIVNAIIAPRIARLHANGEQDEMQMLVTYGVRISFMGALVVLGVLVAFGKPAIILAVGPEFVSSWTVALVLSTGFTYLVAMGPVTPVLLMTGKEGVMAQMAWVSAALNGVLNFILIQYYGAIGAAIATVIVRMAFETGLWYYTKSKVGIRCDVFFGGNGYNFREFFRHRQLRKVPPDDRRPHDSEEHE